MRKLTSATNVKAHGKHDHMTQRQEERDLPIPAKPNLVLLSAKVLFTFLSATRVTGRFITYTYHCRHNWLCLLYSEVNQGGKRRVDYPAFIDRMSLAAEEKPNKEFHVVKFRIL